MSQDVSHDASLNPELMLLAKHRLQKQAFQPGAAPAPAPAPAPAAGGAPGGMGGMAPPAQPDPAAAMGAMAGMPGGMPPGGMPGAQPAQPPKMKPEQMMQMLDFRLYNMQQQLTAIMHALKVDLPPDALVLPPGSPMAPPAEAALPGGPMDSGAGQPGQEGQGGAGAAGGEAASAIPPIEPIQGAQPQPKTAASAFGEKIGAALMVNGHVVPVTDEPPPASLWDVEPEKSASHIGDPIGSTATRAAALAAMYRSVTAHAGQTS